MAGISGILLVTLRRVIADIIEKLVQNIMERAIAGGLGRVLSRLLGVVGVVLLGYDLIRGNDGALPQIKDALKSEEVKIEIRNKLAAGISTQMKEQTSVISEQVANSLLGTWDQFCSKNLHVCTLTTEDDKFKKILEDTPLDDFSKLSSLVSIFIEKLGRTKLNDAIEKGTFEAIFNLPDVAYTILEETRSPESVLTWADLANEQLERVVEFKIYKHKTAGDFNRRLLDTVLALNDQSAIDNILLLQNDELNAIAVLPTSDLLWVTTQLSLTDIKWV